MSMLTMTRLYVISLLAGLTTRARDERGAHLLEIVLGAAIVIGAALLVREYLFDATSAGGQNVKDQVTNFEP